MAAAYAEVLSFSQIREPDAVMADLLTFMSCIEWKAIPHSILPGVQSEERMEKAIGTLCGYSYCRVRKTEEREEFSLFQCGCRAACWQRGLYRTTTSM